ncbi:MAG: hypothetical protein ACFFDF_08675 [Candidatus Odinarchaeota archaeon]
MKQAKCIKGFSVPKCDDNGFEIENVDFIVKENTIWNIEEDEEFRMIGGDVRLVDDDYGWLEISNERFEECFEIKPTIRELLEKDNVLIHEDTCPILEMEKGNLVNVYHPMCDESCDGSCLDRNDYIENDEDEEYCDCIFELDSGAKTEYEKNMYKLGYGFFSNYRNDCELLEQRINHFKKNGINFRIGIAYNSLGEKLPNDVSLYIKDWNKPGNIKLIKLVHSMVTN